MARVAPSRTKINTEVTQLASRQPSQRPLRRVRPGRPARPARVAGGARGSVRDPGRQVVELDCGITVYPPEAEGEPWRAVFTENGQRRYRQATTEAKLVAKLEKVRERLEVSLPNIRVSPLAGAIAAWSTDQPVLGGAQRCAGAVWYPPRLVGAARSRSRTLRQSAI